MDRLCIICFFAPPMFSAIPTQSCVNGEDKANHHNNMPCYKSKSQAAPINFLCQILAVFHLFRAAYKVKHSLCTQEYLHHVWWNKPWYILAAFK